uniref:Major facilitator superfamily associated domain-containing protein n=1 Tax=Onchocerca volvulus TaxID=6282 RepID=A0A2K6VQY6_ONCVO
MALTINGGLCCGQLAMGLMQTFFMFYYVKVFLNIYKIDQFWFGIAQMLFAIWNAINDPLFGYAQDVSTTWFHCRTKVISILGPFLAGSFLILWFPWNNMDESSSPYVAGCHLIFGLFFYDAFYSCVNVAWSALFAETTCSKSERISAVKFSQFAILLSVNIIPITEKLTNGLDDFRIFQYISIVVAVLAVLLFEITGSLRYRKKEIRENSSSTVTPQQEESKKKFLNIFKITKQILRRRDFGIITITYFLQTCRSAIHLNFAAIATEVLIPEQVMVKGSWKMSFFYAACTLIPQLLVILSGKIIVRMGAASVVMKSFIASMCVSVFLLIFGYDNPYLIILFMFLDSILVHSISPLYQVLLADYIDEDMTFYSRPKPISTIIYGLAAVLVRPAQSIAPFIIVVILAQFGYKEYQKSNLASIQLVDGMFYVICSTTFIISAAQLLFFYSFALKSSVRNPKSDISV